MAGVLALLDNLDEEHRAPRLQSVKYARACRKLKVIQRRHFKTSWHARSHHLITIVDVHVLFGGWLALFFCSSRGQAFSMFKVSINIDAAFVFNFTAKPS